jgi:ornithine cyclodeaminase/alanine dehydrogenase-like protein (mu-crystallin family)
MVEAPRYESIQIVGSGNIAYHLAQRLASSELYQSIRIVSRNESMRETFQHISNKIDFNSNENFNFDIRQQS